ncbi:MAG: hypothetical protein AMXMBFR84_44000 [Candidatus Hydrogenedentota bacterium]
MTKQINSTLLISLLLSAGGVLAAGCASVAPPAGYASVEMTMNVTGYCPCKQCCSWKRTWYGKPVYASGSLQGERKKIGQTASGVKAKPGTVAADKRYPFGTIMDIPGYGRGIVQDRGGAIQGDHIDVFFKNHGDALRWGKQTIRVRFWVPRNSPLLASQH